MLIDNIKLSEEEAALFKNYLTSDLVFFKEGLDILEALEKADSNQEFLEIIEKNGLPRNWTKEEVSVRKENTKKLIDILNNVIGSITYIQLICDCMGD